MDVGVYRPAATPLTAQASGRLIAKLGTPLVLWNLLQSVIGIPVLAIVSREGSSAIAGVGAAGAVYMAACALLWGVDTAVQAIVSRATGAQRRSRFATIVATAHAVSIPSAAVLAAVLWLAAPRVLGLVSPNHVAASVGAMWLRWSSVSVVFLAVTLPLNAVWIASGRPIIAALVTAGTAPIQVGLTIICVSREGAPGAALAMDLAMGLDLFLQCLLALTLVPGFLRTAPNLAIAGDLARMAWPISLQQCLYRAGLVILFGVVAELGIQATAILNVLVTLLDVPSQIQTGLGIAVATLVGQALGRHEPVGAREWGWRASIIASAVTAPFGLAMLLAPAPVAGYFLREGGVVDLATLPMRLAGVGCVVQATATVLGFAFRGAGATKISAFVPFVSFWCFLLPLNFWAVHTPARGIVTVAAIQAVIVVIDAVILMALWSRMSWARVKVSGLDDH